MAHSSKSLSEQSLAVNPDLNATGVVKANKRFQQLVKDYGKSPKPIRIGWNMTGVSPYSRLGAPPNMPYVHNSPSRNVEEKGFDPARTREGYVIDRTDPSKIEKLVRWNQDLRSGSTMYPPMFPSMMKKEVVGGNHLTLTIACYDTGFTRPDGSQYVALGEDTDLENVCDDVHWYFE